MNSCPTRLSIRTEQPWTQKIHLVRVNTFRNTLKSVHQLHYPFSLVFYQIIIIRNWIGPMDLVHRSFYRNNSILSSTSQRYKCKIPLVGELQGKSSHVSNSPQKGGITIIIAHCHISSRYSLSLSDTKGRQESINKYSKHIVFFCIDSPQKKVRKLSFLF